MPNHGKKLNTRASTPPPITPRSLVPTSLPARCSALVVSCSPAGVKQEPGGANSGGSNHSAGTGGLVVNVGAGGRLVYRFAPASVTRLQLTLA